MVLYSQFVIPNENVSNRKLVGYNPEVYEEIKRQLQGIASNYKRESEALGEQSNRKPRFARLEVLANALYEKLEQNENGSISFSLKDVLDKVPHEYLIDPQKQKPQVDGKTKDEDQNIKITTLKTNIKNVIDNIKVLEETPKAGTGLHRFAQVYQVRGNDEYGYIMPK